MPNDMRLTLAKIVNHSLSSKTWSTYKTVEKHLKSCEIFYKKTLNFPLRNHDIIRFLSYLITVKKLKGSTIDVYMSALRQIHLSKGIEIKELRPDIVKSILTGKRNLDSLKSDSDNKRLPVTFSVMKLLKLEINELTETTQFKKLIWAVCCLNFFGGLRVHESLSVHSTNFDPVNTLLGKDLLIKSVRIGKENIKIIQLKIKSPKENRSISDKIIDIYENSGPLCPVKAIRNYAHLIFIYFLHD